MRKPCNAKRDALAKWSPESWRKKNILQSPNYPNQTELSQVEEVLRSYPPLIFAKEVDLLRTKLKAVHHGGAFILQGGDCAESFSRFGGSIIRDFYKLFLQMSVVLGFASGKEIIKIGRIAGQFAKPRTQDFEERQGIRLPSFRGDMVNASDFDAKAREADPLRLLRAYQQSASTLNLLRAFSKGGLADLQMLCRFDLEFVRDNPMGKKYHQLARRISEALAFVRSCGIELSGGNFGEFFTSHEALILHYEEALCREDSLEGGIYDCSAHFLWLGERTLGSRAHLEFLRGVSNPKGIKVSTRTPVADLLRAVDVLNPQNEQGQIALIIRMGKGIEEGLPRVIEAMEREGREVLWMSDPMHANTTLERGVKTRYFEDVLEELGRFFAITHSCGVRAGGLHLEMTGEDVNECIGGSVTQEKFGENYTSQCDPRLNATQALELAFWVAEHL